jgi:hypothetical protein
MVHVKYEGRSEDIEFDALFAQDRLASIGIPAGVVPTPQSVTQQQIKVALAQHFDRGLTEFDEMYVEVNPNGNITVRPEAVFGTR